MSKKEDTRDYGKYLSLAIIIILIFLSYKIIQPYILILISAFILSYLIKPLYTKFNKKIGQKPSAILCILIILLIVILPLGIIIGGVASQASNVLQADSFNSIINKISSLPIAEKIDIQTATQKAGEIIISLATSIILYMPSLLISLIILILGIFSILLNWEKLSKELKEFLPFRKKELVAKDLGKVTNALLYGTLIIAIIQFIVAGIGFYLSGINPYLLLSSFVFFLAFLPGLGPTIIWVPLSIYYIITKNWFTAIGTIITGLILSIYIDTILRTKMLGNKTKINAVIMLIGILGGISLFGLFGFIIGPLTLIYTIEILRDVVKNNKAN